MPDKIIHEDDNMRFYEVESNLLEMRYKQPGFKDTLENAQKTMDFVHLEFQKRKRALRLLVDLSNCASADADARKLYSTQTAKMVSKIAFICASTLTRAIAAFFMGLNKPAYPCKMFATREEALKWLKS